jgi:hypothetical protein
MLMHNSPPVCYLGNEIELCSVDHCWLLNTEHKLNLTGKGGFENSDISQLDP